METSQVIDYLKTNVPLFQDFPLNRLETLVAGSRIITFEPKEAVIEFGKEGLFLGVLLNGQAEISITDDSGDKHMLEVIEAGELFGVPSLMTGNKTMSDVIGLSRCTALVIPQQLFASQVATHLPAITYLSKLLIERMKAHRSADKDQDLAIAALKRSDDPYGFKLRTDDPMKVLVINCGGSEIRFDLFDTWDEKKNISGSVSKIDRGSSIITYRSQSGSGWESVDVHGHADAMSAVVKILTSPDKGALRSLDEITVVGHRVVNGGDRYNNAMIVNDEVLKEIENLIPLAPLHNPYNMMGIVLAQRLFTKSYHVAVFDTGFHQTMPAYAYLYGLPYEFYEQKKIRRYGFHGMSHQYVSLKVAEFLKRPYNELETIICHLGSNGSSICGVDHGRSVDTSMGFTPNEGLIMGRRSGDVDAGVALHLMESEGMDRDVLEHILNLQSGLLGLSGISDDITEIEEAADRGEHRALLAIKTYAYRVRKYIGAYVAALGGAHVLAFTGRIGENSVGIRSLACQGLAQMGVRLDEQKNREITGRQNQVVDISAPDSRVRILVVPRDEARMIARQTIRALAREHVTSIIQKQTPVEVPIEISAHHVHLSQAHLEALYGEGHKLTPVSDLSQPGQYASAEKVDLIGPKGVVKNVRVLGPTRKETQVEISMTEQFRLGVDAPIRESGALEGSPGITLQGPKGNIALSKGVICALRHIHMHTKDALSTGLKDKDVVRVRVRGDRELIFGDVLVRVSPEYRLAMHIDTDEGNAASLTTGAVGLVDSIQIRR
ncbi:MAG: acetate/propionate family kinase [Deltaproteobacteria bacterium]|nr:acetate/propionate family kinase [Deltaproteobacteria bacterium]